MLNDLLEVALIGKTVGLRGAVKLHNKSDFPEQFKKGAKFYLANGEILEILTYNKTNSTVVFVGFDDINKALTLTNKILYQTKENTKKTCKLNKNEFFYFDILGLKIFEDGKILGSVVDILENGANYLFEIQTDENLSKLGFAKSFFIPYIDVYVEKISLEDGKILTKNAMLLLENS